MSIYLIRHGQSEFNAAHGPGKPDSMIFDAPLTEKGRQQAQQARAGVADLGILRVVASPLTRAIQTAQIIFGNTVPIQVASGHHEQLIHSCDVGRTPDELQQDFPDLAFDHLQELWWHQGPLNENGIPVEPVSVFQQRAKDFIKHLSQLSDEPVAFVGHGNMFRELIGYGMENCQIHHYSR